MGKQCLMFMLLLTTSTAVTQESYLDGKTMPHVYVIVRCSCNHIKLFIIKLAVSRFPLVTSRHIWTMKTVRNSASCLLLLAASTAVTQELYMYLDEKTMPHVSVIVSRIHSNYTRVIS